MLSISPALCLKKLKQQVFLEQFQEVVFLEAFHDCLSLPLASICPAPAGTELRKIFITELFPGGAIATSLDEIVPDFFLSFVTSEGSEHLSFDFLHHCKLSTSLLLIDQVLNAKFHRFYPLFHEYILENVLILGKDIPSDVGVALIIKEDTGGCGFVQEQTFDDLTITSPAAVDLTHGLALAFIGSQAGNVAESLTTFEGNRVLSLGFLFHHIHLPVFPSFSF